MGQISNTDLVSVRYNASTCAISQLRLNAPPGSISALGLPALGVVWVGEEGPS